MPLSSQKRATCGCAIAGMGRARRQTTCGMQICGPSMHSGGMRRVCSRAADGVAGGAGRRGAWRHGWRGRRGWRPGARRGRDRSETMACMHAIVSPATPFSETNACMHAIVSLDETPCGKSTPATGTGALPGRKTRAGPARPLLARGSIAPAMGYAESRPTGRCAGHPHGSARTSSSRQLTPQRDECVHARHPLTRRFPCGVRCARPYRVRPSRWERMRRAFVHTSSRELRFRFPTTRCSTTRSSSTSSSSAMIATARRALRATYAS